MVFADGRMVDRVTQLESEVAALQDTVAQLIERIDVLEADPVVDALRGSLVEE
jgi:hypothetical protein